MSDKPNRPHDNADGWYSGDSSFIYDYEKIARETGYTAEEVRWNGVSNCRNNPRK